MKHERLFRKHIKELGDPGGDGEAKGLCPFHPDKNPSFGVNLVTGKWRCYAGTCGKAGGVKKFKALLGLGSGPDPIEPDVVEASHIALKKSPKLMRYLQTERGLSAEIIDRFKLGWDGSRIWIPVVEGDRIVNVRMYSRTANAKLINFGKKGDGYGKARIFFPPNDESAVVLCEGEFDALCAVAHGHNAITQTGGSGTWTQAFTKALRGRNVVIAYDNDEAGREGATLVAKSLHGTAASVSVATVGEEGEDVSDVLTSGRSLDPFLEAAEPYEPKQAITTEPDDDVHPVHLSESSFSDHAFKRISTRVVVAGKDLAPYTVPFRIRATCEGGSDKCAGCGINGAGGEVVYQFQEWQQESLQMIAAKNAEVDLVLAKVLRVPGKCYQFDIDVEEYANVESIKCIPELDWSTEDTPYVIRQLFFMGHGMETNRSYELEAVAMPDPKTQYATALIYDAKLAESNIDSFEMTESLLSQLRIFQP